MKDVVLDWVVGETKKKLVFHWPSGSGGIAHVMLDNYYQGQLVCVSGRWMLFLQQATNFQAEELQIIVAFFAEFQDQ